MRPPTDPRRLPFVIAAMVVLVAAVIAIAVAIDNADSATPVGAVTSPKATAKPTPTPAATPISASPVASTPCRSASFGAALGPLNEPSNPHVYSAEPAMTINTGRLYEVVLHTVRGDITLCLEPKLAPHTVNVIVTLARNDFYDGIPFHRVCPNSADSSCTGGSLAIAQVGDPNCIGHVSASSCGSGGPGFKFNDEPIKGSYTTGCVAMANSGANTNGSQFFICTGNDTSLPKSYNLFGVVSSGLNVAQALHKGDVINSVTVLEQN